VFVYLPREGAVEIIAKGGTKVQQALRKAFCKAALATDVEEADPDRAVYGLDHLLDPTFAFPTEPEDRVASVRLKRILFEPDVSIPAIERLQLQFEPDASHPQVRAAINKQLTAAGLKRSQVSVTQVGIQIRFVGDGGRRNRTLTINVGLPNTYDLKSKPDDVRVVGERCIHRWGIVRD
jgi:hypothetical protein